jgi:hypothetical protein
VFAGRVHVIGPDTVLFSGFASAAIPSEPSNEPRVVVPYSVRNISICPAGPANVAIEMILPSLNLPANVIPPVVGDTVKDK